MLKTFLSTVVFVLLFVGNAFSQELTAKDIIKKADDKAKGYSSQSMMTMTIVRPDWKRSVTFKAWSKGQEYSLILILSPAKEKGQVFLKRNKEMWNWLPSIDRMVKIPTSMMMQSWMGSDFTNDDLVKESSIVVDYNHKLLGKEIVRGQECYKIELIPLEDAPVEWGKVIVWITVSAFNQWKTEFYDEDMQVVNVMNSYDIKRMDDREIPTRMEIIPADKPGNKTVLVIDQMFFNKNIEESFFSQQNMKKVR